MTKMACVLGGSGFVGRVLTARLVAAGYCVRVPTRRAARHRALGVLPGVELIETNVHHPAALAEVLRGATLAVNLIGILNEHRRQRFDGVHVALPQKLAAACVRVGVPRLLHMSALKAGAPDAVSRYLKTKGLGEDAVHGAARDGLAVTSFQPSVVFGSEDRFFNRFAALLKLSPGVFPLACPTARFAPVYVGDVAAAFVAALEHPQSVGQRYALCGPRVYTLRAVVAYTAALIGARCRIVGLSPPLSWLQAALLELAPGTPFSRDNYRSLQTAGACDTPFPFDIHPTPVEAVVPHYLAGTGTRAQFDALRRFARHD